MARPFRMRPPVRTESSYHTGDLLRYSGAFAKYPELPIGLLLYANLVYTHTPEDFCTRKPKMPG